MEKTMTAQQQLDLVFNNIPPCDKKRIAITTEIAVKIIAERVSRKQSQAEFASFLGIKQSQLSKYESGTHNFTIKTIVDLFDKLDIPFDIYIPESRVYFSVPVDESEAYDIFFCA